VHLGRGVSECRIAGEDVRRPLVHADAQGGDLVDRSTLVWAIATGVAPELRPVL
jgi:hypothetical protein